VTSDCYSAEWLRWFAIDHQFDVDAVIRKLEQIYFSKLLVKFLDKVMCILGANAE